MADIDKGVGRPGSDGPDLGGLDEDILTADLAADLVDDLGDDGLGEDALGDSDESAEEDESEESEDSSGDDDGDGFGDSAFSGGFGDDSSPGGSFLGGSAGTDGSGFSSSSSDSFDFDGAVEDSVDFGDSGDAGGGADRSGWVECRTAGGGRSRGPVPSLFGHHRRRGGRAGTGRATLRRRLRRRADQSTSDLARCARRGVRPRVSYLTSLGRLMSTAATSGSTPRRRATS